jgi:hypothetical protein
MGPPPSDAGHEAALCGNEFISLIAHVFFSKEVVWFSPTPASWPRCVSDAENHTSPQAQAVKQLSTSHRICIKG